MTFKMLEFSAKTIVVSELKSTLRNSFHVSVSSHRSEDVKMLRVTVVYRTRTVLRILLLHGTTNYSFSLFRLKYYPVFKAASKVLMVLKLFFSKRRFF